MRNGGKRENLSYRNSGRVRGSGLKIEKEKNKP